MRRVAGWLLFASPLLAAPGQSGRPADARPFSFVVLGHIRGNEQGLNPKLGELLAKVRALRPDLVFLTGDIIWGDVQNRPLADSAKVERDWNAVDSALVTLGVPVFRVPGNHDISDVPSRDIYVRRYGKVPAVQTFRGSRFLLLSSAWIPADGETRHNPFIRGVDLDSAQVAWVRRTLADSTSYEHTFVFVHHLLWWEPDSAPWWREVHPLLARGKVDAVFSGDYGPLKFSTKERDGVRYYQSSIEVPVALPLLQNRISSRLLSSQFDAFLEVRVAGPAVDVAVHTVAEVSSGEFTPERWRSINEAPARIDPLSTRLWRAVGSPKRLAALLAGLGGVFGAGWLASAAWGRRRG